MAKFKNRNVSTLKQRSTEGSYNHGTNLASPNASTSLSGTEDSYDSAEEFSFSDSEEEILNNLFYPSDTTRFSQYLNRFLLLLPVSICILFRSIASQEFRKIAIAWAVIIPFTSEISMDEAVIPAMVAASLGFPNSVIARNMYISIARSRLGLVALAALSLYFSNYHILVCGIILRLLVSFSNMLLESSIPKSEITLICGGIVNALYHISSSPRGNLYEPTGIVACGLFAALPCYPLFVRFTKRFRKSHGKDNQKLLVISIYACYFSLAIYLYFFAYGVHVSTVWDALSFNADLICYWLMILSIAVLIAVFAGNKLELDGRRKLWHLTCVLMFFPEQVRSREFTKVSLAVIIVLFISLETARATALPPFGLPLHRALRPFVDHRDQRGPVIISHVYLLLGISVPIFLNGSPAGVICLGLGDTLASQVGRRFGTLRVFGHKSIEGCLAFAFAASSALYFLQPSWTIVYVVVPTALLEAVTPLNDNLIVPMYMLALQGLLKSK